MKLALASSALAALLLANLCKKESAQEEKTAEQLASAASAAAAPPEPAPGTVADTLMLPVLGTMPIPETNPTSEAKVELGRMLFFDPRLSVDGSRACYSCHLNEDGTGGHDPLAIGAKEKKLTRHSPILWNVGYATKLYWDGRSDSLEAQGAAAWAGGNMGVGKENLEKKAKEIGALPDYKKRFAAVFPGTGATPDTVVQALSAYERTLVCDDTKYDKYAKGDKTALDTAQKHGLELFMGKAGCVACHAPPHFTTSHMVKDGAFFNVGIGIQNKKEEEVDVGRMSVTKATTDWAAFRPPTLRNVSKSPPYFHDGSVAVLKDAVKYMTSGGFANKNKSTLLLDKQLSEAEVDALVSFLGALECGGSLTPPDPKGAAKAASAKPAASGNK